MTDHSGTPSASPREREAPKFHRSVSCGGEKCTLCGKPADLKVGEEIMHDDPMPHRHNWTAYICAACGTRLFFPWSSEIPTGSQRSATDNGKAWSFARTCVEAGYAMCVEHRERPVNTHERVSAEMDALASRLSAASRLREGSPA